MTMPNDAAGHDQPFGEDYGEAAVVAPQVTDAVTQSNMTVLGSGPSVSTVQSIMTLAQAQGVLFANMVNNQQQLAMSSQASTAEAVAQILGVEALD